MKLKKFLLAITAVGMLAAIVASSASASAVTEAGKVWRTGASHTVLASGATKSVSCSTPGTLTMKGTVGAEEVELTASGIKCEGATIFNEYEGTTAHAAKDEGKLTFTGVKLVKPTNCTVPTEISTNALKSEIYMESTESGVALDKFEPATGSTGNFATITLSGSCAASGARLVKGTVYGRAKNHTGVYSTEQPLEFSSTINSTAGGSLTLAGNAASLAGTVTNTFSEVVGVE
jgi:hypothetical protein